MQVLEINSKKIYEITPTKSGENIIECPACYADRKKKSEKTLSWNNQKGAGHCWRDKCQAKFVEYKPLDIAPRKEYKLPQPIPEQKDYSPKLAAYFMSRGIFESTMKRFKIAEGEQYFAQVQSKRNAIKFPYYRGDKLINVKCRDAEKHFTLESGAELIPFNLNSISGQSEIIITEGEFDCMAIEQSGFKSVISVPNGAAKGNNTMEWLDNTIDYFEQADRIILATDKDAPGVNLRTQLAARLGVERCYKVDFEDCKDSNEVLIKHGEEKLRQIINSAEPFPIEGAFTTVDIQNELDALYENGLKRAYTIGCSEFDELISFECGRLYTVTGVPSHGKSKFVDFVISRLNLRYKMKVAYFSPETYPIHLHTSSVVELLTGKRFSKFDMPHDVYSEAKQYTNDEYFWIMPEDSFSVENILSKARQLVLRKGVQILVIDPYNKLEHQTKPGENETQYISRFLDSLVNFAHKNNVILFLVAHPRKMAKQPSGSFEVPTLYDINGSANFYNKTDFGITVYRNFADNYITTYVNKVKFRHLGKTGECDWKYNLDNNRFSPYKYPDGQVYFDNVNWLREGFKDPEQQVIQQSQVISKPDAIQPSLTFEDVTPPF